MGSCCHQCQVWHQQNLSQHTRNTRVCLHSVSLHHGNLGIQLVDNSSKHEDLFSCQLFVLYRGFHYHWENRWKRSNYTSLVVVLRDWETPLKNLRQKYPSTLQRRASNWSPEPVSRWLVFLCCRDMQYLSLSASKRVFSTTSLKMKDQITFLLSCHLLYDNPVGDSLNYEIFSFMFWSPAQWWSVPAWVAPGWLSFLHFPKCNSGRLHVSSCLEPTEKHPTGLKTAPYQTKPSNLQQTMHREI